MQNLILSDRILKKEKEKKILVVGSELIFLHKLHFIVHTL